MNTPQKRCAPSRDDIQRICRFFSLGKLLNYEKEKGIIVSHCNSFFFVTTDQGQYMLKFYPPHAAKTVAIDYAINRLLIDHYFPTPLMGAGLRGQPLFASNDRLVTCFSYIDGRAAWEQINEENTIHQINYALLSIKSILSTADTHIPARKQASLTTTFNDLAQESRRIAPYDQKEMIEASLLDACRAYQEHQILFTRQWLHSDANLNNFLIDQKNVYTLDLEHVRIDYTLSDLASLVISCLLFNIPVTTISIIVKDYFTLHKIDPDHFIVLNTLVKTGLIRKYLKNIQRKESVNLSRYPPDIAQTYTFHLSADKGSITNILKE